MNDCYPEKKESDPKKRKTTSVSYEDYVNGIEHRGFDAFLVDGKQIKVDTTDFSQIDMEGLFAQIAAWKDRLLI